MMGLAASVLVVDDEAASRESLADVLRDEGYDASVAANGEAALDLLRQSEFDLVITDLRMPELDGLETTSAIRKRERSTGGHIPIVALTAHVVKGDAERCLAAGMDAYLAKPLRGRDLFAAIESVLEPGRVPASTETAAPAYDISP